MLIYVFIYTTARGGGRAAINTVRGRGGRGAALRAAAALNTTSPRWAASLYARYSWLYSEYQVGKPPS